MASLLEFVSGFLIMNSMAHLIIGLTGARFLSLFGYSATANIAYSIGCMVAGLAILFVRQDPSAVVSNGLVLGCVSLWVIFLLTGRFFFAIFANDR
ncbi:hypothetical protein [Cognatishimia maritima]|uniref:Uncharacterized protein n=1 Tax=Cognatishimia maritima TaxID=870908 RepID=A0A1M5VZE1_9RHOB|nr:hypothetical protein [Cognatishimia maritima]SHH80293.1 hypothetical protein SAMN04488044_3320 [Cognatishimia maritima]